MMMQHQTSLLENSNQNESSKASPLLPHLKNYPLVNETVLIFALPDRNISKKSNIETIIPSENSELKEIKKDTYDNALQSYYEMGSEIEFKNNLSGFEKEVAYNDLKDILLKDLAIGEPTGNYKINVF